MKAKNESHTHIQTSTVFKADAGTKKYHCGFFCQRKTDTDVVDPKNSEKEKNKRGNSINQV